MPPRLCRPPATTRSLSQPAAQRRPHASILATVGPRDAQPRVGGGQHDRKDAPCALFALGGGRTSKKRGPSFHHATDACIPTPTTCCSRFSVARSRSQAFGIAVAQSSAPSGCTSRTNGPKLGVEQRRGTPTAISSRGPAWLLNMTSSCWSKNVFVVRVFVSLDVNGHRCCDGHRLGVRGRLLRFR